MGTDTWLKVTWGYHVTCRKGGHPSLQYLTQHTLFSHTQSLHDFVTYTLTENPDQKHVLLYWYRTSTVPPEPFQQRVFPTVSDRPEPGPWRELLGNFSYSRPAQLQPELSTRLGLEQQELSSRNRNEFWQA